MIMFVKNVLSWKLEADKEEYGEKFRDTSVSFLAFGGGAH